jgi:enamine deaminase RidA (YjgF/YER057c/UK114 family)
VAEVERQVFSSGSPYEPIVGYSRAVRVGDRVFVAGSAPIMADGSAPPPDAYGQARRCLEVVGNALEQAGASLADVVRTRAYLTDASAFDGFAKAHGEAFSEVRPANTTVVVAALLDPRWLLEIEAEAVVTTPE